MGREMCLVVFLLVSVFNIADVTAYFKVNPPNAVIEPGLTKTLSLHCTTQSSNFDYQSWAIVSIIISKSEGNSSDFSDIVSISSSPYGDLIHDIALGNAKAQGNLSGVGPYLEATWNTPSSRDGGVYRCSIYCLDASGRPQMDISSVEIEVNIPDSSDVIDRVIDLRSNFDLLTKRLEAVEKVVNDTYQLPNFRRVSTVYQHRRYYLSQSYISIDDAETECELEGGYLAEIDNADEFSFIQKFLNNPKYYNDVVIGARDEFTSGEWVHIFSNRTMTYANWAVNGTGSTGCIALGMHHDWKFKHIGCEDTFDILSLCEIPG